jgi:hypothetical protein
VAEPSTPPEVALDPLRDRPAEPWLPPDLESASLADLFTLYGSILDELTRRDVVRTRNQPLGDYSEWLVWHALSGQQSANRSEKSFDITADLSAELLAGLGPQDGGHRGARIQVKARAVSPTPKHHQLQTSPFHAHGFDYLALVLHEESDFSIRRAVLLPTAAALAHAKPASARRDDVLRLRMTSAVMGDPTAVDITERLQSAASA